MNLEMKNYEEKIEKIIIESFEEIRTIKKRATSIENFENERNFSHIIFPKYFRKHEKEIRYSEQELRYVFLNKLQKENLLFSIETPTKFRYRLKEEEEPKVLFNNESSEDNFQSAMIDTTLYDLKTNIISHIEFKYGQCPVFPVQKDFLKLICELDDSDRNYFVHYFSSSDKKTKNAICDKYGQALNAIKETNENIIDLNKRLEKVTVFVMFMGLNEILKFSLNDSDFANKIIKVF